MFEEFLNLVAETGVKFVILVEILHAIEELVELLIFAEVFAKLLENLNNAKELRSDEREQCNSEEHDQGADEVLGAVQGFEIAESNSREGREAEVHGLYHN